MPISSWQSAVPASKDDKKKSAFQKALKFLDGVVGFQRFSLSLKIISLLPMVLWLLIFQILGMLPAYTKAPIDVTTLPKIEFAILFGGSLQHFPRSVIPDTTDTHGLLVFFDFLAGFAYLIHFGFSWLFAVFLYFYYKSKHDRKYKEPILQPWTYLWCFGWMNFLAVFIQLTWPTAPPWYTESFGETPASYDIPGSPASLIRVDEILGFPLFSGLYGQSPVVFGSFPSLHAAWPVMFAFFAPKKWLKIAGGLYSALVWWAAMYLNHHWFVDLLGGLLTVIVSFVLGKRLLRVISFHLYHRDMLYHNPKWSKKRKGAAPAKWATLPHEKDLIKIEKI